MKDDYCGRPGVELLQTDIQELKTFVQDRLRPRAPARLAAAPARRRVYLMFDPRDLEAAGPIESHLFDLGLEVVLPSTEGDEGQLQEEHQANLVDCDGALIFHGQSSELWLRAKLRDLDKAPGFGRTKAFLAKTVYLVAPSTPAK